MALSAFSPLTTFGLPPSPISVASVNSQQNTSDKDTEELITDPKLSLQKRIIEELFEQKDENEKSILRPAEKEDTDTIILSAEALELYNREYGRTVFENNGERLEIEFERIEYLRVEQSEVRVQEAEPLVLDLNGNGIELTDIRKGEGVSFDITGDGVQEQVSWVSPGDGMLVYDRNGNSIIDNGRELFGDQHGAENGFEELAKFDTNSDDTIDETDAVYTKLKIWQDLNQNGFSEAGELKPLEEYGIASIDLKEDNSHEVIAGNRVEGYSTYRTDSESGKVGEVYFNYLA